MNIDFLGLYNYWVVIFLMMAGFYTIIAYDNLIKKIIGLNIFQSAVFMLYISVGKVSGGSEPIAADNIELYSNPLPHVLILTAIVVGVATTSLGLALTIRIKEAYGTINENDIVQMDRDAEAEKVREWGRE